jgi:hypothetical protein
MMHDPFLHIEPRAEEDAAPRPGSWWLLALLMFALGACALFAGIWRVAVYLLGGMVEAALAIGWPV